MNQFESLRELISLLTRVKTRQIRVLGKDNKEEKDLSLQLYHLIQNEKFSSEEEIAEYFYSGKKHSVQYGRRLVKGLKKRLLPTLFLIDVNQPSYSNLQRAFYSVQKNYALVQILLGKGARNAAIELAEETIKASIKYGFTSISVELARNLSYHYTLLSPTKRKSHFYKKTFEEQKKILEAEHTIEKFYINSFERSIQSRASSKSTLTLDDEKIEEISSQVRQLLNLYTSNRLDSFGFQILFLKHEKNNDHSKIIQLSEEAIKRAQDRQSGASSNLLFNYSIRIISASIILKKYSNAREKIGKAFNYTSKESRNWFILQEFHLMLHFHTRNWEAAYDILLETINNEGYKRQPAVIQEQWIVYKGYIQYLITIGKIQLKGGEQPKSFRIGKFLNEVPTYSKDKRGTNISIIIIQLLFLLQKRQYDQYIDRVDALRMYAHRYLRNDETFRSNCFIQMMLQIPKANFNRMMAVRKADKYWNRLLEVPLEKAKQGSEVEIIPYETLWTFALQSLEEKPRRTRIA